VTPTLPTLRDPDRLIYFKEEVGGLSMGGYETDPIPWARQGLPRGFEFQLLAENWDHFEPHMLQAMERVPALAEAGIKQMINGPESFTPDGNFMLGEAPEVRNIFVGCGFNAFGIASAGGAGWALASWVMTGEQPMDLWVVDIRRFSEIHRDDRFVCERTLEAYGKHYAIAWPHDEYLSARPRIVSPLYERLRDRRAVFGSKLGWERPNWFAEGMDAVDIPSQGRANWFKAVGDEHRACRERVVVFDQSSFAKFELRGREAAERLEFIAANRVARGPGRLTYTQMLNTRGGIECDLTVAQLAEDHFYIVTGTGFRTHDGAWIRSHLGDDARVSFDDVTERWGTLSLMGPHARAVLAAVSDADVSNEAAPFGSVRQLSIAGHDVRALRVTYVGELGWELHVPLEATGDVFDALMVAGAGHGIRPAGYRALESLRLEKGYRAWGSDITPGDSPVEAGLGWAVKLKTNTPFLGREATAAIAAAPLKKKLVCLTVASEEAHLVGRETILRDGEPVGYLASGGWGYTVGQAIGYGYLRREQGVTEDWIAAGRYELDIANRIFPAELHQAALYDPTNARVKS
jgi:sarcosine dehydrogenase